MKNKEKYKIEEMAIFLFRAIKQKHDEEIFWDVWEDIPKKHKKEYLDLAKIVIEIAKHE